MANNLEVGSYHGTQKLLVDALFCIIGVCLNIIGSQLAVALGLPLFFDTTGTIAATLIAGPVPGVIVGYLTNLVDVFFDPTAAYFGLVSVVVALAVWVMDARGWLATLPKVILSALVLALVSGGISSVIVWFVFGFAANNEVTTPLAHHIYDMYVHIPFVAQLCSDILLDLADKGITLAVVVPLAKSVPQRVRNAFDFAPWQQTPLSAEERAKASGTPVRTLSLRMRVALIVILALGVAGAATATITFVMFRNAMVSKQSSYGYGVTGVAAKAINADHIDDYLANGEEAEGYLQTEHQLEAIRDSFEDVEYVYVYQIREDGCHVVFDPDTPDTPGSEPGEVVPFDDAFEPQLKELLAGQPIDPVVSDESYGWLLSVYQPIYSSAGACKAYVAADILMNNVRADSLSFLARVVALFTSLFILVCVLTLWYYEFGVVMPLNSMSMVMNRISFDDVPSRGRSLASVLELDVHTGDEIESLYHALADTVTNTAYYITQSEQQTQTISRMQDNLIMVLADLVESRDHFTGEHVRKTAAYVRVTLDQMRREGIYADQLTDTFVDDVVHSAPLHDIGKIVVSDVILNSPRRLTDEEFAQIKRHTTAGAEILESAVGAMSDPGYLDEARRLALYHHERWDGSGYPTGIAGNDIPLSARVMAVADVFDALVSKRSYKDGMPIERALDIIREGIGTHFDPQVAQAFLDAEVEVRRIAEENGDAAGTQVTDVHDS